jgi:hypothetical protein
MYTQDYDQRFPQSVDWMDSTYPYGKNQSLFQCPTVKAKSPTANGYAFNSRLAGKTVKEISTPALTGMIYDSSNLSRNASDPLTSLPDPARHLYRDPSAGRRRRDQHVNMMGYADGHVQAILQGSAPSTAVPIHSTRAKENE